MFLLFLSLNIFFFSEIVYFGHFGLVSGVWLKFVNRKILEKNIKMKISFCLMQKKRLLQTKKYFSLRQHMIIYIW